MGYQGFEELEVWKKARELKIEIAALAKTFPSDERFRLTDQMVRSSRAIPCQIAEGHGRKTFPDKLRFCVMARGSLSELLNHAIDAFDEKYIDLDKLEHFRNKIADVERLLNGYISFLEKKINTK